MAYSETLAERVRAMLNGHDVEERRMFGGLAFLVGGRMCCGVQDTDLMVRVPKDQHAQALAEPHVRPMDFTGRSLTGFVYVAPAGTIPDAELGRWVALGERVARDLTPATKSVARRRPPRQRG